MSKISLSPDASGTGIFTIASPNSNTNRTLTLPDDTGTIVTNSGNQAGSFTTLNTSGAVVFNDAGADVDFRVEGDTDANLLFVDAGNDRVGIGTNTPATELDVAGTITSDGASLDGAVVINESGTDVDFRVEGDTNANLLFVDASADKVGVGTNAPSRELAVNGRFIAAPSAYGGDFTAGTNAVIGARQTSTTDVVSAFTGNTNAQGTAQFNRIVERYPVVSLGTKLIIPFVSQGSLNSGTICRLMGQGARFNSNSPLGFTINFAVGHLTTLANLASWGGGGNYSSIAINGMNIEITFTTAYTSATSNGLYLDLEYMTNNFGLSIDVANIAMN